MSDSSSGSTRIRDGMRYRVTFTRLLSNLAAKFRDQASDSSSLFFCHQDPESPFFALRCKYGKEEGLLTVGIAVTTNKKAVIFTSLNIRLCDVKGRLLKETKSTDPSPWKTSMSDTWWGAASFYKPDDAAKKTGWKLFIEFEYEKEVASSPSTTSSHDLQTDLLKLLEDTTNADVTFIVQGESIKAHKNILTIRSQYFQRMFTSDVEENVNGEVNIPDIEPETFRGLLRFLYSGLAPDSVADNALDLLLAADKYGVDGLKQICEEKASIHRHNVVNALLVADSIKNEKLMTRAKAVFRSHVDELMASGDDVAMLESRPSLLLQLLSHYAKQ